MKNPSYFLKPDGEYTVHNLIVSFTSGDTNAYELQSACNHIDFTEDYSDIFDRYDLEHQVPFCWSRLQLYGILIKLLKEMKNKKPFSDTPNYDVRAFDKPFSFGYNVLLENCSDRVAICERIIMHLWKNEPLLPTTPDNVPWGYEKFAV